MPKKRVSKELATRRYPAKAKLLSTTSRRVTNRVSDDTPSCLLLQLPAEIRNMIYEYALTNLDGLEISNYVRECTSSWETDCRNLVLQLHDLEVKELCTFNQLQSVNRQLHYETKGLEVKLNPLVFQSVTALAKFADVCSPSKLESLSHVILSVTQGIWTLPEEARAINYLGYEIMRTVEFSALHPHIRIDFHFEQWDPMEDGGEFIERGVLLNSAIRGMDRSSLLRWWSEDSWVMPDAVFDTRYLQRFEELRGRLNNLRFWPTRWPEEQFCSKRFVNKFICLTQEELDRAELDSPNEF